MEILGLLAFLCSQSDLTLVMLVQDACDHQEIGQFDVHTGILHRKGLDCWQGRADRRGIGGKEYVSTLHK